MPDTKLAPQPATNKTTPFAGLQRVVASVDMIGWFTSYGLSDANQSLIEKLVGKRIVNRPCRDGWIARIPTPHHHLMWFLEYMEQRGITANLVHIAFDLRFDKEVPGDTWPPVARALHLARSHLVLHSAPNAEKKYYDNGNFYFKEFARPRDEEGKPIGSPHGDPARHGLVYRKPYDTLRIEPRFSGGKNIDKHLPPLHVLLDTDPRKVFCRHLRWRTYRPRLLARTIKEQEAYEERQWLLGRRTRRYKALTGIWPRLLTVPSERIAKLTVVKPLDLDVSFDWL